MLGLGCGTLSIVLSTIVFYVEKTVQAIEYLNQLLDHRSRVDLGYIWHALATSM